MSGDARPRSHLAQVLIVVLAAFAVFMAFKGKNARDEVADARATLSELDESLASLRTTTETLVRERAQARIERAEARERADDLAAKLETASAALTKARADLARASAGRDEHLAVRLELEARLQAALSELAK